ncbi:hypothetical protein AB9F41_35360, partial [Rhizobium leguminosarum]
GKTQRILGTFELGQHFLEGTYRQDFARRSFPFHRTLFNAIAAGDPEAARAETLKILRHDGVGEVAFVKPGDRIVAVKHVYPDAFPL